MQLFEEKKQFIPMPDIYRQKLLDYADSFKELAKTFGGSFQARGEDRRKILEERKLWENRQVISSNLNEMAVIMSQMAGEVFRYKPLPEKKWKRIFQELKAEKINLLEGYQLSMSQERVQIALSLQSLKKGGMSGEKVADMLSVLLDIPLCLSVKSPGFVDDQIRQFVFVEEARYVSLTGYARVVKEKEIISGDNYSIFESEQGLLTMLLSDGTGSGEEASEESGHMIDMMEKLLEAGYQPQGAVKMVNAALFAKQEELGHPTLDLCHLDLYRGRMQICKVGGSVTYIKHDRDVRVIQGGSLPLGIFQNIEVEMKEFKLRDGDYVIMMTDGVLDAFCANHFEEVLLQKIEELSDTNPKEIAEKILQMAIYLSGGVIRDDMTVLVAGIWDGRRA